jgi:hypothetical protein
MLRTVDDIDICDEVLGRAGNRMSAAEVDAVVMNLIDRITARMQRGLTLVGFAATASPRSRRQC